MILKGLYHPSRLTKSVSYRFGIRQFKLPDLGEKIKEAVVKKWTVKVGDQIEEFDTVAEVATDKLYTEIPSPYKGRVQKLYYQEEEACNVGDVLLDIDTEEADDDPKGYNSQNWSLNRSTRDMELKNERTVLEHTEILASPAVRLLAKKLNVRMDDVQSNHKSGRILKEDIYAYLYEIENSSSKLKDEVKKVAKDAEDRSVVQKSLPAISPKETETRIPVQRSSQVIQDRQVLKFGLFEQGMVKSMTLATTVPHFNLHDECDITELEAIRKSLKNEGKGYSLFSYIVKAYSLAINTVPKMNASYYPDSSPYEYLLNSLHNISIAIDSPQGLAAPNIKNVNNLSIADINDSIKELQKLTAEGRLSGHHLTGGTIALSNIGTISGSLAAPLNLPNQVCIVALGKLTDKPVYNEATGSFRPRKVLPISFGCDHRVLDGATVARFSLAWKQVLENPGLMLTQLR